MKKLLLTIGILVAVIALTTSQSYAQQKVTERKLLGTWKLVIDIEEEMEEAREEMEEEDNILGELLISGVTGFVEGLMDNIDIYFEFMKNGELKIMVEAFGEEEIEYGEWYINSRGELIIEDSDTMEMDGDDYWMFDGSLLVAFEDNKRDEKDNVFMKKIE